MEFFNSNFTASVGDYNVVDTSGGSVTCSLPDTTGWGDDNIVNILLQPSGALTTLTIDGYGSQQINGSNTLVLNVASAVKHVKLVMGGGNWYTF